MDDIGDGWQVMKNPMEEREKNYFSWKEKYEEMLSSADSDYKREIIRYWWKTFDPTKSSLTSKGITDQKIKAVRNGGNGRERILG